MNPATPWWSHAHLLRLLSDLIAAELERLRPGGLGLGPLSAPGTRLCSPDLDLGTLDLDSLEFLDLATLVSARFQLDRSGLEGRLLETRRVGDWVETILASRARWDTSIGFQTSGSTGRPRLCTHPMRFLEEEVGWLAQRLADRRRVLVGVPSHHIYGFLFAVILPAALDIPVLDVRGLLPGSALRRARPGDLVLGYPTFFELACRDAFGLAEDVVALTSTAPCPSEVWECLRDLGCARIMEIYGASETAGIGLRDAGNAPFRLLPHWSREPGALDRIQRLDAEGRAVSSTLPDRVEWLDAERFKVLGRRDGAVQIGGMNVYPQRVQRLLCAHPEVSEAMVRRAGSESDARLKAFVVPEPGCEDPQGLPERLHRWLREHLTALECPRSIRVGDALPQSVMGKPSDWD